MSHVLDRPVWSALTSRHAALAEGGDSAWRYPPGVIPFGAARDDSRESLDALVALLEPGEMMVLVEKGPLALPNGPVETETGSLVQMILDRLPETVSDARIAKLSQADIPDMLALAALTKPGPFTPGAQALGDFFGIRIEGKLAAMTGVRMRQSRHTEISGVCTHPDHRGKGLARGLTGFVTQRVLKRGDTPYLHTLADNAAAIRLYETLGYVLRAEMNMAMIRDTR